MPYLSDFMPLLLPLSLLRGVADFNDEKCLLWNPARHGLPANRFTPFPHNRETRGGDRRGEKSAMLLQPKECVGNASCDFW